MKTISSLTALLLAALLLAATAHPAAAHPAAAHPAAAAPPPPQQSPDPTAPATPLLEEAAQPDRIFLPFASNSPTIDLRVAAIEVTQAAQNNSGSVPLVQGRPAVARVFVTSAHGTVSGVSVTLSAARNGVALPGSPMRRTLATVGTTLQRGSGSANFLLPAAWLSGNVALTAQAGVAGADQRPADNVRRLSVAFRSVPPLQVTVVPVRYVHAPTGKVYPPVASVDFPSSVRSMFPVPSVNVRLRAPVSFTGNLVYNGSSMITTDWERLLNLTLSLKRADGAASGSIYIAVLPGSIMNDHPIYLAGVGSSQRVAVAFDLGLIPAHELGHTLGRLHAPCGNPSGLDPHYPYPGASIGVYGYDTSGGRVYAPSTTTDLMSYCEEWVSDYTYVGMLNNHLAVAAAELTGAAAAPADGVLVRASLATDGRATLHPVYALQAPLTPGAAGSRYTAAFLDAAGTELGEWPLDIAEAEEKGVSLRTASAVLPRPNASVAAVQLRQDGVVVAERPLRSEEFPPLAATVSVTDGDLVVQTAADAIAAELPLLVRQQSAAGWTTLALDAPAAEIRLPTAALAGGDSVLELIPADVVPAPGPQASAASAAVTLPDRAPTVWIGQPQQVPGQEGMVIDGYASDPESGTLTPQWTIDGAPAGEGPLLLIESLERPLHVTLSATDHAGQTTTAALLLSPLAPGTDEEAPATE